MKFWTAVKIWDKSTVYIIGGGPSLLKMNLSPIHDKHVIGVNNAYKLGDWVDICWWGDTQWWDKNNLLLDKYSGLIMHCGNSHKHRPNTKRIMRGKALGIEEKPSHVAWNHSSGASAINIAYHLGAGTVVLLGFDMKFGDNHANNWHKDYPVRDRKWNPYSKFLEAFPYIQRDADKLGLKILNATPDSALDLFPKIKLEDTL